MVMPLVIRYVLEFIFAVAVIAAFLVATVFYGVRFKVV